MTILPDEDRAAARLSDFYRHNLTQLGTEDVIVANMGGSGQSLIGNILHELGLNYVDGYTEVLRADGSTEVAHEHAGYRRHLATLHRKDTAADGQSLRLWPRFVKTHHPPVVFDHATYGPIWLLVRDPRDTIYALYRWRASFGEEEWDQVPDTFEEFLRGQGDFSRSPIEDWVAFHTAWLDRAQTHGDHTILRFEDLKQRPVEVVSAALRGVGVSLPDAVVRAAVEASSFERMRAHEDQMATGQVEDAERPRMIRAGKINGWTEWMTPDLARLFTGSDLVEVGRRFGYELGETE
jgi:hypothetical protein